MSNCWNTISNNTVIGKLLKEATLLETANWERDGQSYNLLPIRAARKQTKELCKPVLLTRLLAILLPSSFLFDTKLPLFFEPKDWDESFISKHHHQLSFFSALPSRHVLPSFLLHLANLSWEEGGDSSSPPWSTSSSPSSEMVTCAFVSSLVSTHWTLKYKLQESRESCLVYCCPCNT